jgi:hypothetical protein
MKTAISIPDPVFNSAEELAARLGISRSELYCRALRELLDRHDDFAITAQLDAVHGDSDADAGLDPALAAMQLHSIGKEQEA